MVEFDITLDWKDFYDYNLRHSYSSFSGIMGTVWGLVGLVYGIYSNYMLLAIVGVLLVLYLPINLVLRSKQTYSMNDSLKKPFHYRLDDDGITVSQGEETVTVEWEKILKATSTGRSIILYTSKVNATIFPRRELGEQTNLVIQCISTHMDASKVKIRF